MSRTALSERPFATIIPLNDFCVMRTAFHKQEASGGFGALKSAHNTLADQAIKEIACKIVGGNPKTAAARLYQTKQHAALWILFCSLPEMIKNTFDAISVKAAEEGDDLERVLSRSRIVVMIQGGVVRILDNGPGFQSGFAGGKLERGGKSMLSYQEVSPDGMFIASNKCGKKTLTGGAGAGLAQASAVSVDKDLQSGHRESGLWIGNMLSGASIKIQCDKVVPYSVVHHAYGHIKSMQGAAVRSAYVDDKPVKVMPAARSAGGLSVFAQRRQRRAKKKRRIATKAPPAAAKTSADGAPRLS